jgi:hypothetical protein
MECYLEVHCGLCFNRFASILSMSANIIVILMAACSCKAQLCIITILCLGAHSVMVQLVQLDLR